jgi:hypothetical protein
VRFSFRQVDVDELLELEPPSPSQWCVADAELDALADGELLALVAALACVRPAMPPVMTPALRTTARAVRRIRCFMSITSLRPRYLITATSGAGEPHLGVG